MAPGPPTRSDNMIFTTTATATADQEDAVLTISGNRVPVVFDQTTNEWAYLPANGTVTAVIVTVANPPEVDTFELTLYYNNAPTSVVADVFVGNNQAVLTGLTLSAFIGDYFTWVITNIAEPISFTASINFVPS